MTLPLRTPLAAQLVPIVRIQGHERAEGTTMDLTREPLIYSDKHIINLSTVPTQYYSTWYSEYSVLSIVQSTWLLGPVLFGRQQTVERYYKGSWIVVKRPARWIQIPDSSGGQLAFWNHNNTIGSTVQSVVSPSSVCGSVEVLGVCCLLSGRSLVHEMLARHGRLITNELE